MYDYERQDSSNKHVIEQKHFKNILKILQQWPPTHLFAVQQKYQKTRHKNVCKAIILDKC